MRKSNYSSDEINFIKTNYSDHGAKFCSTELNRPYNSVRYKAKQLGLNVSKSALSFLMKNRPQKTLDMYRVNPLQFMKLTSPISIYILGLLWADGCISFNEKVGAIDFSTTYPDGDYFIPIFNQTGSWRNYRYGHPTHPTWKDSCQIKTTNKPLAKFLQDHDYTVKSNVSADKILSIIPDNLKHYWFLGLLDGDGHISINRKYYNYAVTFSSSINQDWNFLAQYCESLDIKFSTTKVLTKTGSSSVFLVRGKHNAIKLLIDLYKDYEHNQIGLPRKYNKYLEFLIIANNKHYSGVCKNGRGKWRAYTSIKAGRKQQHLGTFSTKYEAESAVTNYYFNNPELTRGR